MFNPYDPTIQSVQNSSGSQKFDAFFHPEKYITETKMVSDSEDDLIAKTAKEMGINLDDSTRDMITQYVLNDMAQKSAWERQMDFEKNRYQFTVQDLQKAGLNPFLAISGMNAGSASAGASSVQGGIYATNRKTNMSNGVKAGLGAASILIAAIASIVRIMGSGQ